MFRLISFLLSVAYAIDPRKEEFDQIKKYELVNFDTTLSSTSNRVSFEAFGRKYDVELVRNDLVDPSKIEHMNGNLGKMEGLEPHYTHLTESCHYNGHVIGEEEHSSVAISICDKRGIRGFISAFGDTLNIKPAKYFDPEYDRDNYHSHTDEHLVYKLSDYADYDTKKQHSDLSENDAPDSEEQQFDVSDNAFDTVSSLRRRLVTYNNGRNNLQVYNFVNPKMTSHYKKRYGSVNYYDALVSDIADAMNGVNKLFSSPKFCSCSSNYCPLSARKCSNGNWDGNTITIQFVAIEVATTWNGIYYSAQPSISGNQISASSWLSKMGSWLKTRYFTNKLPSFDLAYGWIQPCDDDGKCFNSGGIANEGAMCATNGRSLALGTYKSSLFETVGQTAHEIGHVFGAPHDGATGWMSGSSCNRNAGLMGYGQAEDAWSQCSKDSIMANFKKKGGLTCLGSNRHTGSRVETVDKNIPSVNTPFSIPTKPPTPKPTVQIGGSCSSASCVSISGLDGTYNGVWYSMGCYNGQGYYCLNGNCGKMRFFFDETWKIAQSFTASSAMVLCTAYNKDFTKCTGSYKWLMYKPSFGWKNDAKARSSCAAAMEIEDKTCLDDNAYGDSLCVYNNATIWDTQHREFSVGDVCKNEKPFYEHVVISNDTLDEFENDNETAMAMRMGVDLVSAQTYYLHHQKYFRNVDDTEQTSQWVLSIDAMENEIAWCYQDDLTLCVDGQWEVRVEYNDTVTYLFDGSMSVSNKQCLAVDAPLTENEVNMSAIIAAVLIVCVCLFVVIGSILLYRSKKVNKMTKGIEVGDDEEMAEMEEEDGIEVDMETK